MKTKRTLLALSTLLAIATTRNARADDDGACSDWFCDAPNEPSPEPTPTPTPPANAVEAPGFGALANPLGPLASSATVAGLAPETPIEVSLDSGSIVSGVVVAVGPQSLTLRTNAGLVVNVLWSQVAGFHVVVAPKPASPLPKPVPPEKPQAPEKPPAPEPIAPQPAPTTYDASPAESYEPAPSRHEPGLFGLGLRLGLVQPTEGATFVRGGPRLRDYVGPGGAFELSVALNLTRAWSLRGFYEEAWFAPGAQNGGIEREVVSQTLGVAMRVTTELEEGFGLLFELGLGRRWLTIPRVSNDDPTRSVDVTWSGLQSLRVAAGPTFYAAPGVRTEILVQATAGGFDEVHGACGDDCGTIPESERVTHAFLGAFVGLSFEP